MDKGIKIFVTGGTFDKEYDMITQQLAFKDTHLREIFELSRCTLNFNILTLMMIDSLQMTDKHREIIRLNCELSEEKQIVITHGTDTMAYTASAFSFMLENLNKAVIFTGSQIPIGARRTDAKENLITAIEIAASGKINEVSIYFEDQLYKGNRTVKVNSEHFEAFASPNYPILAEAGVNIKYKSTLEKKGDQKLKVHKNCSNDVAILKLFPGIKLSTIDAIIKSVKGIVIESFGAGNASTNPKFTQLLSQAIKDKKIIVNISQCLQGEAVRGQYETNEPFEKAGVICGKDMTTEAAVTKLMFLLGQKLNSAEIKIQLQKNLRGEISN